VSELAYTVVDAPRVAPPRISLLASAQEVNDGARWQAGIGFDAFACGTQGGTHFDATCVEDEAEAQVKNIEPESRLVTYMPYAAYYGDRCSSATFLSRDFNDRAAMAYVDAESAIMANELWTGATAAAAGFDNAFLASADADVVGGVWPAANGLAILQNELAAATPARGMIHASRDVASIWYQLGIIRREGAFLLDAFDNIVVADTGYPGTGPTGQSRTLTSSWIYATDVVQVRRENQIRVLPDSGDYAAAMDRETNLIEWRAERLVAAYWSGCAHIAIAVDVCETECPVVS